MILCRGCHTYDYVWHTAPSRLTKSTLLSQRQWRAVPC